jgi:hypothetical protein
MDTNELHWSQRHNVACCCGTGAQLFLISMFNIVNSLLKVEVRLSTAPQWWELSVVAGPVHEWSLPERVVVAPLAAAGKEGILPPINGRFA